MKSAPWFSMFYMLIEVEVEVEVEVDSSLSLNNSLTPSEKYVAEAGLALPSD